MKKLFFALVLALSAFSAQAQTKIAHINSQSLLDTMPSRKRAIAEINEIERKGLEELKEMNTKFEKAYYEYLSKKDLQSPEMNQYDEGRLQKMQQDMQNREAEIDALLQKMSADLNDRILKTVKEAVAIIAKKKGLNYVIDESTTLFSEGTNITSEVIPELLRLDAQKNPAKTTGTPAPRQ